MKIQFNNFFKNLNVLKIHSLEEYVYRIKFFIQYKISRDSPELEENNVENIGAKIN